MELSMTMTRNMGASRTFQSIFPKDKRSLTVATVPGAPFSDENEDDDEELLWNDDDEGTTLRGDEDDEEDDNNNSQHVSATCRGDPGPTAAPDMSRRGIEAWAEDDDDEDGWKDALQARVDQLELAVPNNNGESGKAQASHKATKPASRTIDGPYHVGRTSRSAALNTARTRVAARSEARATNAHGESNAKTTARKRTGSADYTSRACKGTDQKRATRASNASRVRGTGPHIASMLTLTRSVSDGTAGLSSQIPSVQDASGQRKGTGGTLLGGAHTSRASYLALSDAEAIRRHVLDDVKRMTIERVVSDVKRLHYLEQLQRNERKKTLGVDGEREEDEDGRCRVAREPR